MDLRDLPQQAFVLKEGPKGKYYDAHFYLCMVFGAGCIEFQCVCEGKVIGSVSCEYF